MEQMAGTAIVIGAGAAAGLGGALARRIARERLHVFIGARNAERIETLAAELRGRGLAASAVAMDATQPADVARLFDAAAKVAERPELVVYNAGNAHVVIDGAIDGDQLNRRIPQLRERLGPDGMLAPDAIAEAYWQLHLQPRSAWTLELDLRPYKETF
jgi:NADP-dependent 3-hydroxy acid dehydrogenase YdfG